MLYFSPFCLNLVYVNVYVPKLGGGVVPKSDVYNYSDPSVTYNFLDDEFGAE